MSATSTDPMTRDLPPQYAGAYGAGPAPGGELSSGRQPRPDPGTRPNVFRLREMRCAMLSDARPEDIAARLAAIDPAGEHTDDAHDQTAPVRET